MNMNMENMFLHFTFLDVRINSISLIAKIENNIHNVNECSDNLKYVSR